MKTFLIILLLFVYGCSNKKGDSNSSCGNISMTIYEINQGSVKLGLPSAWKVEDSSIFMKDLITQYARVIRSEDTTNWAFITLTRVLDPNREPKTFSDLDFSLNVLAKDNLKSPDSIIKTSHNSEKGWKIATRKSITLDSFQNMIGQILAVNDSLKLKVYFKTSNIPNEKSSQVCDCIFQSLEFVK